MSMIEYLLQLGGIALAAALILWLLRGRRRTLREVLLCLLCAGAEDAQPVYSFSLLAQPYFRYAVVETQYGRLSALGI